MEEKEWVPILRQWSAEGDTKLHFFAEKVLYNCRKENEEHLLDAPIFVLYDNGNEKEVGLFAQSDA